MKEQHSLKGKLCEDENNTQREKRRRKPERNAENNVKILSYNNLLTYVKKKKIILLIQICFIFDSLSISCNPSFPLFLNSSCWCLLLSPHLFWTSAYFILILIHPHLHIETHTHGQTGQYSRCSWRSAPAEHNSVVSLAWHETECLNTEPNRAQQGWGLCWAEGASHTLVM